MKKIVHLYEIMHNFIKLLNSFYGNFWDKLDLTAIFYNRSVILTVGWGTIQFFMYKIPLIKKICSEINISVYVCYNHDKKHKTQIDKISSNFHKVNMTC